MQKLNQEDELFKVESSGFMASFPPSIFFAEPAGNLHGGIDDRDGMLRGIDSYCRAHPRDPLFAAAANLVLLLKNQAAPPKP